MDATLLTVKQAAKALNFSTRQIKRWSAWGALQPVRFGRTVRFRREEIERVQRFGLPDCCNFQSGGNSRRVGLHTRGKEKRVWEL